MWFVFLGALRNVGFAIGGLAAGAVVMIGTDRAFHALVLANAVSYLFAFAALTRVPAGGPVPRDAGVARPGWGMVLRDHPYLVLVTTNAAYALSTVRWTTWSTWIPATCSRRPTTSSSSTS